MGRARRSKNRGEMCKVFSFIIKMSKREIGAVCLSVGQHFSIKRKTTSLTLLDPTCTRDQTAEGRADPKYYENNLFCRRTQLSQEAVKTSAGTILPGRLNRTSSRNLKSED